LICGIGACLSGSYGVYTNMSLILLKIFSMTGSDYIADYSGLFGDARLERRGKEFFGRLSQTPSSSIRRIALNNAEQRAFYRFLNNSKVSEESLIEEASRRMEGMCEGRDLLCIQDTSEINLVKHKGRHQAESGLGRSDNSQSGDCFKLHPGLVMDAHSTSPLGFSAIKVFHRSEIMPDRMERKYKSQPIEEKESYKWIEVAERSKEVLKRASSVTFIEDREGDIFEQFALIPEQNFHLLVRSRTTRKLIDGKHLYKEVESAPVAGTYTIELPTDKRKNQYKRTAEIELRFVTCSIQCPENLRTKGYPSSISVSCISAKEQNSNVSNPVNWKLLTTHKVEDYQRALTMVEWYSSRWYIEQLFRLLKKQGFGIEQSELESGWAIRKQVIMQMTALLKILQMNIAYADPEGGQPIEDVLDSQQIEVLKLMNSRLQGKTQKQQNQNDPKTTKWAAWIVGRLGGWKGYDSQGPPGVITLIRGVDRLNNIIEGFNLAKDVYTP
jgi:hypothetical protein